MKNVKKLAAWGLVLGMLLGSTVIRAESLNSETGSKEPVYSEMSGADLPSEEASAVPDPLDAAEGGPESDDGSRGLIETASGSMPSEAAEEENEGDSVSDPESSSDPDPAGAYVEEELTEDAEEVEEVTGENEWSEGMRSASVSAEDDGVDNETLFEKYIQQCFDAELPKSSFSKLYSRPHTDYNLSPVMSTVLASLKTQIRKIASGERTSSSIDLSPSEIGVPASVKVEASDEFEAYDKVFGADFDYDMLFAALLYDCPYELYWFDKTGESASVDAFYFYPYVTVRYNYSDDTYTVATKKFTFQFLAAEEYRGANLYTVKGAAGQTVKNAVSNAKAIVSQYTGTYDKDAQAQQLLTAYKNKICDLTDYNDDAANPYSDIAYGNPWQLLWVFDNNPSTKVVCEGYAKAFEYLCNLTGFKKVNCYTVSGWMYSEYEVFDEDFMGHMWNIVTMDDGRNYIADITNCDDVISNEPFLTGYESGSVWDAYIFRVGWGRFCYRYDDNIFTLFTQKDLTLSAQAYGTEPETPADMPSVTYRAKVVGERSWTEEASDGESAGTTGQSRIMEAFMIQVVDPDTMEMMDPEMLGVKYSGHIQNVGWESSVANGEICGRPGKSLRVEAASIKLTGKLKDKYDIYYCMHCQNYGWLAWAKNGELAGTAGLALRVEAIRVMIVKRPEDPSENNAPENLSGWNKSYLYSPTIYYSSYVEGTGWQDEVTKGKMSGTSGQSLRLEGFKIRISGEKNLGVRYRGHVQYAGWEKEYVTDGEISGQPELNRRIEALELELTGSDKGKYDIYYCLHVQNFGWLAWAKNGEPAGSSGVSMRVEAYIIRILPKGSGRPQNLGTQTKAFVDGVGAASLTLNRKTASISRGGKVTLTATVKPDNRTFKGVTWKSSNTAVATVSGGVVTGKAKGTAVITCTSNDGRVRASCTVTVR